jgi:hypothetical protein
MQCVFIALSLLGMDAWISRDVRQASQYCEKYVLQYLQEMTYFYKL